MKRTSIFDASALVVLVVLVSACASDPASRREVSRTEAARIRAPETPLASFARIELAPIGMSPDVASDPRKVAVSRDLGVRLEARLRPLRRSAR